MSAMTLTPELLAVLTLCLLAPLNAIASAAVNSVIMGLDWGLGNRTIDATLPNWAVRLQRSHRNLLENLPSFLGVVLIAHVTGANDIVTSIGAWVFVALRVAFALVYTLGITRWALRTVLYYLSLGALAAIAVTCIS